GELWASPIETVFRGMEDARGLVVERPEADARKGVVDAAVAGTVGHEGVAVLVPGVSPMVDQAAGEDLELLGLGAVGPGAAGREAARTPWGLDVRVNVNALIEIEYSVLPPAESVDDVVRILGAETGEDDARGIGFAVAVGVLE